MGILRELGAALGVAGAIVSSATGAAASEERQRHDYERAKASEERGTREREAEVAVRAANEPTKGASR